MSNHHRPIEIDTDRVACAVAFSANGEHLVSGSEDGVGLWRVHDGKQVARMGTGHGRALQGRPWCLAVSQDGRRIAAGTVGGDIFLWNATTYEQVAHIKDNGTILAVDFSPGSMTLVSASRTATIWDSKTCKQIRTLQHASDWVNVAKYSPQGHKIATATDESVQVWNSQDGTLLLDIPLQAIPQLNNGLLWFNNHLFAVSDGNIVEFDASTGSMVWASRLEVPHTSNRQGHDCIALSKNRKFIAYSRENTVTVWDTLAHKQSAHVQLPQYIRGLAISLEDQFAIALEHGKIVLESWDRIFELKIDTAALDEWKCGRLENADASLTAIIVASKNPDYRTFACRALIRARLRNWSMASADAKTAIDIQPSVIGYLAKSLAHAGNGEKNEAYRAFDLAFLYRHPCHILGIDLSDNTFLLLMKAIIVFMAGEYADALSRMDDLTATVWRNSTFYVVQAHMHLLVGNSYMLNGDYEDAIQSFKLARAKLRTYPEELLTMISLVSGWKFDDLDITIRQGLCEAFYSAGRAKEAGDSLLELVRGSENKVYKNESIVRWISDFTQRCLSVSDTTLNTAQDTDSTMLCAEYAQLLREWAKATLTSRSSGWKDALGSSTTFIVPKCAIYHTLCERLKENACSADSIECLLEMANELAQTTDREQPRCIFYFKDWCGRELEDLGDGAMNSRHHDNAIVRYTAALSLKHIEPRALLVKRSKALVNAGLWLDALNDANEVIVLDPSSSVGYERKYVALRGAGHYRDAGAAFKTMLTKMTESTDPDIREHALQYVQPAVTESSIREAIQEAIRDSPPVLINTHSGRLLDKIGQASSFESQPIFYELVFSMTTHVDLPHIQQKVGLYYRYATFSHKWKHNEPLYEMVINGVVYELEGSPTHEKLQNFCKIAREAELNWAWTDTCCINKADPSVLQEALVSMFHWYQSSSLTVVLLCDAPWRRLVESIWNTRAWTFQEYHASKVVRFYNKDWKPYKELDAPNHKECPEIIAEMEEATGISAEALMALRPGLEDIREKLRLASTRQSTRAEDAAYSLLGIFALTMPVVYGEGDRALGQLLAQLLTGSGDTSILAWTGRSGGFNSSLPATMTVFSRLPTSHIPPTVANGDMETAIGVLRRASLSRISVTKLHDCLNELSVPSFIGKRMKLPCIIFKLGRVSSLRGGPQRVFRAQTKALGVIQIQAEEDLARFGSLTLVHPWIDFLLDRQPVGSSFQTMTEEPTDNQLSFQTGKSTPISSSSNVSTQQKTRGFASRFLKSFGRQTVTRSDAPSLLPPSTLADMDKEMHAFQTLARLRQPFGALLLTPDPGNVAAYRRVAAESLVTVQVQEITPVILDKLIGGVRMLDVL